MTVAARLLAQMFLARCVSRHGSVFPTAVSDSEVVSSQDLT